MVKQPNVGLQSAHDFVLLIALMSTNRLPEALQEGFGFLLMGMECILPAVHEEEDALQEAQINGIRAECWRQGGVQDHVGRSRE